MTVLPVRSLVVEAGQLRILQRDVWSDRFVQAEFSDGTQKASIRLRYRGGHTRNYPKRSYEIRLGSRTYHYNAEYDDPSLLRNALSFQFFGWLAVPSPRAKHCLLYLNGQPLGVYLEIEGVNRSFFRRRGLKVRSLFYAVNDHANFSSRTESGRRKASLLDGYQRKLGTREDGRRLAAFIRRLNAPGTSRTRVIKREMDIDNYARWLSGAVLTGNYDGFVQNYSLYRSPVTLKYRMLPWDYEGTWGRNCYGKLCGSDLVRVKGYNELTRQLLRVPSWRSAYKRRLGSALRRTFTVDRIMPVVESMHGLIRDQVRQDVSRKWTFAEFEGERGVIRRYVQERRRLVQAALERL
ncbi:CotH kinase family protein [Paenibacillus filicis]|uniref:CotH kinase family protein n=1 Tax=Paenibacillus filicis TaxID=669464 RepID=A0ABU9DTU0_9BACL